MGVGGFLGLGLAAILSHNKNISQLFQISLSTTPRIPPTKKSILKVMRYKAIGSRKAIRSYKHPTNRAASLRFLKLLHLRTTRFKTDRGNSSHYTVQI